MWPFWHVANQPYVGISCLGIKEIDGTSSETFCCLLTPEKYWSGKVTLAICRERERERCWLMQPSGNTVGLFCWPSLDWLQSAAASGIKVKVLVEQLVFHMFFKIALTSQWCNWITVIKSVLLGCQIRNLSWVVWSWGNYRKFFFY